MTGRAYPDRLDYRSRWMSGSSLPDPHIRVKIDVNIGQVTALWPGQSAWGWIQRWDGSESDWVKTGVTARVYDWIDGENNHGRTFALDGEVVMVFQDRDRGEFVTSGEEQGLVRLGQAKEDISGGSSGTVEIMRGQAGTGIEVEANNSLYCVIDEGDFIAIKYFWETGEWEVIGACDQESGSCGTEILTTLTADLCPEDATGTVDVLNAEVLDGTLCYELANPVANILGLAGTSGDMVVLKYRPSAQSYFFKQIEHHVRDIVIEDDEDPFSDWFGKFLKYTAGEQGSCGKIQGNVLSQAAIMSCGSQSWKDQITLNRKEIVTDLQTTGSLDEQGNCPALQAKFGHVCDFETEEEGEDEWTNVLTFQQIAVVVNHRDNGSCAQLGYLSICVVAMDAIENIEWEDFICGVDCPTSGSGSGSGSGQ